MTRESHPYQCKWCDTMHSNEGTMECTSCWEVRARTSMNWKPTFAILNKKLNSEGLALQLLMLGEVKIDDNRKDVEEVEEGSIDNAGGS